MNLTKNEQNVIKKVNNERYIAQLARECGITHGNTVIICHRLESKGLVYLKRVRNKKYVMLTEEGEETQKLFLKLSEVK